MSKEIKQKRIGKWDKYTNNELIKMIQDSSIELNRTPGVIDIKNNKKIPGYKYFEDRFNCGWNDIILLCGLELRSNKYIKNSTSRICKICGRELPMEYFNNISGGNYDTHCKECRWIISNKDKLNNVNLNQWTIDDIKIIVGKCLRNEIKFVNDLLKDFNYKALDDFVALFSSLKINTKFQPLITYNCEFCHKENQSTVAIYKKRKHHFCNKECFDDWQRENSKGKTRLNLTCDNCGIEITKTLAQYNKHNTHFCSSECQYEFISKNALEIRKCKYCNEEFTCKKSSKQKFCSKKCANKGGYHKPKTEVLFNCDFCGEQIYKDTYSANKSKNHFCSKKCFRKWYDTIFSQTKEFSNRMKTNTLTMLKEGKFNHLDTGIQSSVNSILQKIGIEFVNESIYGNYSVDNYLLKYNLIIECMGDYWHCNPLKYKEINYQTQLDRIIKDKAKNTYIKKYNKINVLYLWESDSIEVLEALIQEYISNNGVLKNYHSFNYNIINNKLILNNIIIKSYTEYSSEQLNLITDLSIRQRKKYWIKFDCDNCGQETSQLINNYKTSVHHFCSNKCKHNYRLNNPKRPNCKCDYCGRDIYVFPSRLKNTNHNFCDRNCYNKWKQQ
jgi:hypothetical protein